MIKSFKEFVTEAKVDLHPGVTLHKTEAMFPHMQHKGKIVTKKAFDVHLHGHHIGKVEQTEVQAHKKIGNTRLVKAMAPRIGWRSSSTSAAQDKHGTPYYRATGDAHHQHEAANHLARHFANHIKKED